MAKKHITTEVQSVFQTVQCAAKKTIHHPHTYSVTTKCNCGINVVILSIFRDGTVNSLRSIDFGGDTTYKGARKKISTEIHVKELAA